MATSQAMGRPKIEGLVSLNLRLLQADLDALDAWVIEEREARHGPGFNRTDLIREIIGKGIRAHAVKRTK